MKTEQEKELLICSYSEYDRTGYDINVMYENCVDNQSELLALVDKEHYEWYGDKLYKATKDDLINYLNDNLE